MEREEERGERGEEEEEEEEEREGDDGQMDSYDAARRRFLSESAGAAGGSRSADLQKVA